MARALRSYFGSGRARALRFYFGSGRARALRSFSLNFNVYRAARAAPLQENNYFRFKVGGIGREPFRYQVVTSLDEMAQRPPSNLLRTEGQPTQAIVTALIVNRGQGAGEHKTVDLRLRLG